MTTTNSASPSHREAWPRLKFGLMLHWGLYSVAGGVWKGRKIPDYNEQIKHRASIPWDDYHSLCSGFTAAAWDPNAVAQLATEAGMRYVVITTKHHEGFNLWDTKLSSLSAPLATPASRDVLTPLSEACRQHGLGLGFYYSLIDWYFPGANAMSDHNCDPLTPALTTFTCGQLRELLTGYGPLCEIWFDMGKPTVEQSRTIADLVHTLQPGCMINGRIWNEQHDFLECHDNEVPDQWFDEPWESAVSMFHETWGYRSWQERGQVTDKVHEHVRNLVQVTAHGGNYLLNIGPRGDGSIHEFDAEVLHGIGAWMRSHGEAIYHGEPEPYVSFSAGCVTSQGQRLWLYLTKPPADGIIRVAGWQTSLPTATVPVNGSIQALACSIIDGDLCILLPATGRDPILTVITLEHADRNPIQPAGLCHLTNDQPTILTRKNALPWLRMAGSDLATLRKFVARRTWHVRAPSHGDWSLDVRRVNGGDTTGYVISADSFQTQVLLSETRTAQQQTCGHLTLHRGQTLRIELTDIAPGRELVEIGLELVLTRCDT